MISKLLERSADLRMTA